MDPCTQTMLDGRAQDAPRLLHGEGTALTEDVDELSQPMKGRTFGCAVPSLPVWLGGLQPADCRNHLFANNADVFVGIVAILWRDDMGAEKSRHHCSLPLPRSITNGFQRLHLRLKAHAVTGLGLYCRCSLRSHLVESAENVCGQLLTRG